VIWQRKLLILTSIAANLETSSGSEKRRNEAEEREFLKPIEKKRVIRIKRPAIERFAMVLDDDSRGVEWRCCRLQPQFKSEAARQRRKILEAMSEISSSVGVSEFKRKNYFTIAIAQ
jgi:hypothetical protein